MVDPDRVQHRLELLYGYLGELRRLRGLAGLRNRLVHVYDTIDDARVHAAIGTGLPDIDAFATAVALVARPDG